MCACGESIHKTPTTEINSSTQLLSIQYSRKKTAKGVL